MEEKDLEALRNISAKVGEQFSDYLILVRKGNSLGWKYSDSTWSLGAVSRFKNALNDQAMIDRINAEETEE